MKDLFNNGFGIEIDVDKGLMNAMGINEPFKMDFARILSANNRISEMKIDLLRTLGSADLTKPDGGFLDKDKSTLAAAGFFNEAGNLTEEAKDVVLIRDDRVIKTRELFGDAGMKIFGYMKTSFETVQENLKEGGIGLEKPSESLDLEDETTIQADLDRDMNKKSGIEDVGDSLTSPLEKVGDAVQEKTVDIALSQAKKSVTKSIGRELSMGL